MNVKEIGLRVKRLRKERGMTCEELAHAVGFKNKASISMIELGKVEISLSKAGLFSAALGVSEAYLLGLEQDKDKKGETE